MKIPKVGKKTGERRREATNFSKYKIYLKFPRLCDTDLGNAVCAVLG